MPTKRFISDPVVLVKSACKGLLALQPGLSYSEEYGVLYRKPGQKSPHKVTLLSGGGSGHEPAHAGYVGHGMLDAAVCGAVFASPNVLQIMHGIDRVKSPAGSLVIVKNYTGDRLNFGLAVEKSLAAGNNVKMVVVADDVSIERSRSKMVGRRGLAGTVLVHKVAGAAATEGQSLDQVAEISQFVADNLATYGVGLNGCDVPGQQDHAGLAEDEIELGMGIHNEPGSRKAQPIPSTEDMISGMLSCLLEPKSSERSYLPTSPVTHSDARVVVLVNNLGGLSVLELTALTSMVVSALKINYSVIPARCYAGTFLSALNGSSFSITILSLPKGQKGDQVLRLLDSPTTATGWTVSIPTVLWSTIVEVTEVYTNGNHAPKTEKAPADCNGLLLSSILKAIHQSLIFHEPQITRFDTMIGDGDCGTTLVAGAEAITSELSHSQIDVQNLASATMEIANTISKSMGGTSGALYAIFFTAFASAVHASPTTAGWNLKGVAYCGGVALQTLMKYTAAREGDRTMMDALIPFIKELNTVAAAGGHSFEALRQGWQTAKEGCQATKNMNSRFGRSTYVDVDGSMASADSIPDPGAWGIVAIVEGILRAVEAEDLC